MTDYGRTNNTSISYTEESTPGVLTGSEVWKYIEPNNISTFGATITTKSRNPISNSRGAKKGATIDLDSAVEFDADMTIDAVTDFSKGFMFADWNTQLNFEPTAVTTSAYTVAASGDLTEYALIYARNFTNSTNNGLKTVDAGATATSVAVKETLVAETTPPDAAEIDVVGFQGSSGDIQIDSDGNLISTTLSFTTLGLIQGQRIYINGDTTATQFGTSPGGYARCRIIEANKITLDRKQNTLVTDEGTGKTIQIFFGHFISDVTTDDDNFATTTYQMEQSTPIGSANSYEYAKGNICNSVTANIAVADFATISFGFVGTDTDTPTSTRKAGTWVSPSLTTALSTTADVARLNLAVQSTDAAISTYTKSLDLTIENNAVAEKVVGNLGAIDIGYGDFSVTGSTEVLFTDDTVLNAVRNNTTVTLDWVMSNSDGALFWDIPSMTLGASNKSFPENEIIKIAIEGNAFEDTYFGFSLGITKFLYIPGQDD